MAADLVDVAEALVQPLADFGLLAAQWGGSGSADLNGDGVVGGPDLAVFASVFGARVRP